MTTATTDPVPLDQPSYRATLPQAVRRFFLKYAMFTGRASRAEYWWMALFFVIVGAALWVVAVILTLAIAPVSQTGAGIAAYTILGVAGLIALACLVPNISVTVRRLHDANLSGFLYLLHFIPYLGSLVVLILTLLPSSPAGARFDEPRGYAPVPGQPYPPQPYGQPQQPPAPPQP